MSKNILGIFDGTDIEGLTALIDKLEQSSFDYMNLEGDGVKITIGKNGVEGCTASAPAPSPVVAAVPVAATVPAAAPVEAAQPEPTEAAPSKPSAPVQGVAGTFVVKSPSYGIFYAQSEPGAPAYVQLGDTVAAGDTLGLIEIMKTFNALSAEVSGEIVAIHVQNQELLEPDMPMFSIKTK